MNIRRWFKLLRLKQIFQIKNLWTYIAIIAILTMFQNCNHPMTNFSSIAPAGVHYELPFNIKRVQIHTSKSKINPKNLSNPNENQFTDEDNREPKNQQSSEDFNKVIIPKGTDLTILVNNSCTEISCQSDTDNKSLACYLYRSQHNKALEHSQQFYEYSLPKDMTNDEFENRILNNNFDNTCIVGVSELLHYKKQSFNDSLYSNQANVFSNMNYETGISDFEFNKIARVKVAVIDTGVESSNDLTISQQRDMRGMSSTADMSQCPTGTFPKNYQDYYGHGTAVASIIASKQNNNMGMVGLAPNSDIYSYMIGRCSDTQSSNAEMGNSILAAYNDGVDIINLSYGGSTADDLSLRQAIVTALNAKIIMSFAAGNSNQDLTAIPTYPAAYSNAYIGVLGVGATDNSTNPNKASFSNYNTASPSNTNSQMVKVAAPGVNILVKQSNFCKICNTTKTDLNGDKYTNLSGTSFSAPIVAGSLALIIGFLKQNKIQYDSGYIEQLYLNSFTRSVSSLNLLANGGKFITFQNLNSTLNALLNTSPSSSAVYINPSLSMSNGSPQLSLSVTWNILSTHPGARLGVFDGSCSGTSINCIIQNIPLSGLSGQHTFNLSRNDTVPIMSLKNDVNAALNLYVAIYYPVPKKDSNDDIIKDSKGNTTYMNNYGLDASTPLNLRTLSMASTKSPILGQISVIRMDMQYLYVKGWACLQGSNEALNISLNTTQNVNVPVYNGYTYSLMIPHSTPLDLWGNLYFNFKNLTTYPYSKPFYLAGQSAIGSLRSSYKAGYESNPISILSCNTLTAAHGFELTIPLWNLKKLGLEGQSYTVLATTNNNQSSEYVKDLNGKYSYEFPNVNFQNQVTNSFQIDRSSINDYEISGTLCSSSPSPIEIEVSAYSSDFYAAIFGQLLNNEIAIPERVFYDPSYHMISNFQEFTFDLVDPMQLNFSTLADLQKFDFNSLNLKIRKKEKPLYDLKGSYIGPALEVDQFSTYPANSILKIQMPNLSVNGNLGGLDIQLKKFLLELYPSETQFNSEYSKRILIYSKKVSQLFNQNHYQKYGNTLITTSYYGTYSFGSMDTGSHYKKSKDLYAQNVINNSVITTELTPNPWYNDYFDTGELFSTELVGYKFDPKKPIGKYLKDTYGVTSILREVKRYETPYSTQTVIFSNAPLTRTGTCKNGFKHSLNNLLILDRMSYRIPIVDEIDGLWPSGASPSSLPSLPTPETYMQRLPLNLRFFQDGKLILHLESEYDNQFTEVRYPFESEGYQ